MAQIEDRDCGVEQRASSVRVRPAAELRSVHESVIEYYERNTPFFLRMGEGGNQGHIHRGVWAPGVSSADQALNYVYSRVAKRVDGLMQRPLHILDLGCGVGSGLRYFVKRGVQITGVTISPTQAEMARRVQSPDNPLGVSVLCADFSSANLPECDLMYAVESLVHANALEPVAQNISRSLRVGGELIVCDDFLSRPDSHLTKSEQCIIDCLRTGWQIPSLNTWDSLKDIFEAEGLELVATENWTPFLKLDRWRDKMLAMVMRVGGGLPFQNPLWGSWKAGNALRLTLQEGLTQYRFGIWKKVR